MSQNMTTQRVTQDHIGPHRTTKGIIGIVASVIAYGHRLWSSPMAIAYGHRLWSSPMAIAYGHRLWSSPMAIAYGHRLWSSLRGHNLLINISHHIDQPINLNLFSITVVSNRP